MTAQNEAPVVTDLSAVCEFLLSGREIPREAAEKKPSKRAVTSVPVHNGITRARCRSASKN